MIKIDLGTISPKTALVGGALIVGGIVWLGNKIYNRCKKDRAEFVKFRKEQIAKMEALNLDKLMTEAKEDIKDCIVKLYPTLLSLESDIREGYSYSSIRDSYARYEKICNAIKAGNDVLLKSYVEILNKRAEQRALDREERIALSKAKADAEERYSMFNGLSKGLYSLGKGLSYSSYRKSGDDNGNK